MDAEILQFLACPACGSSLQKQSIVDEESSHLDCTSCDRAWPICDEVPDLTFPDDLREEDSESRTFWNRIAGLYDGINSFTGFLRGVSTSAERQELAARLGLVSGEL